MVGLDNCWDRVCSWFDNNIDAGIKIINFNEMQNLQLDCPTQTTHTTHALR